MKIFIYTLIALATSLIVFNLTLLDFQNLTKGNSLIALMGILACLCTIVLLTIFILSKKVNEIIKNN